MNSTDELRRLLDERGVEWTYEDGTVSFNDGGRWFHAWAYNDGTVCVSMGYLTPEQAIAATLGTGTCELVNAAEDLGDGTSSCMCDKCGYTALDDWWDEFNFCPNCGAKIVGPTINDAGVEVDA